MNGLVAGQNNAELRRNYAIQWMVGVRGKGLKEGGFLGILAGYVKRVQLAYGHLMGGLVLSHMLQVLV